MPDGKEEKAKIRKKLLKENLFINPLTIRISWEK